MPLLSGTFSPVEFNATTLGKVLCEAVTDSIWDYAGIERKMHWVDLAQRVLDRLAAEGIVK
jgi:hypothetical protein